MERLLNNIIEEVVWNLRRLHEGPLVQLPSLQLFPIILLTVSPPRPIIFDDHIVHLPGATQPSPHDTLLQSVGIHPYLHSPGEDVSAVDLLPRSEVLMWIILVFNRVGDCS